LAVSIRERAPTFAGEVTGVDWPEPLSAEQVAAMGALDDRTKAEFEDLVCRHSNMYSRGKVRLAEFTHEERAVFKPVRQRRVRRHPLSGRKSLFLSAYAGGNAGMATPHARVLLLDLTEFARHETVRL
jgi:alpha-ketoglutarate-dependent 2,4-dichlorophenoxyacetate dioxygenase